MPGVSSKFYTYKKVLLDWGGVSIISLLRQPVFFSPFDLKKNVYSHLLKPFKIGFIGVFVT